MEMLRSPQSRRSTILNAAFIMAALATAVGSVSKANAAYTAISPAITASLGSGSTYSSTPLGLNNLDQVVGFYTTSSSSNTQMPFVYSLSTTSAATVPVGAGGYNNMAYGINDSGQITGVGGGNGYAAAFYYTSGPTVNPIAPLNSPYTGASNVAYAINSSGVIAGVSSVSAAQSSSRAFSYTIGGSTSYDVGTGFSGSAIGNYGSNSNFGMGINSSGQIAGYGPSVVNSNTKDPYIASPTSTPGTYTYTNIGTLIKALDPAYTGGNTGALIGIDGPGNVAGNYSIGSTTRGFYYNNALGTVTKITDSLGTGSVSIYGMADIGTEPLIVGSAAITPDHGQFRHGMIVFEGSMLDLNTIAPIPGYIITGAFATNNNGDIVVNAAQIISSSTTGPLQAYLLTNVAIPEPASLGMLAMGATALLARRKRH